MSFNSFTFNEWHDKCHYSISNHACFISEITFNILLCIIQILHCGYHVGRTYLNYIDPQQFPITFILISCHNI